MGVERMLCAEPCHPGGGGGGGEGHVGMLPRRFEMYML